MKECAVLGADGQIRVVELPNYLTSKNKIVLPKLKEFSVADPPTPNSDTIDDDLVYCKQVLEFKIPGYIAKTEVWVDERLMITPERVEMILNNNLCFLFTFGERIKI